MVGRALRKRTPRLRSRLSLGQRIVREELHLSDCGGAMGVDQFRIVGVDHADGDKIIVIFSDDTQATFTLAQLIGLEPKRIRSDIKDMDLG
jgi:hypothetical protein